jgi:hypothetical protein
MTNIFTKAKNRLIFEVRVFHKFKIAEINHWMNYYSFHMVDDLKQLLSLHKDFNYSNESGNQKKSKSKINNNNNNNK